MIRKLLLALLVLGLLGWGIYAIAFNWMVPRTAGFGVPGRWKRVPLRETKSVVHGYYGEPAETARKMETWSGGTKDKQYWLHIYYVADSVAVSYSIHYTYSGKWVHRDYLIDSSSIY